MLKVIIYFLIVDHLAEQENVFIRVLLQRLIADLYGIFNAIAEAKMASDVEPYRSEIKLRRRKILLPRVSYSSRFFDLSCNGGSVVFGDIKFLNNADLL